MGWSVSVYILILYVNVSKALIVRQSPHRFAGGAKTHWLSRVQLGKYDVHVGTGKAGHWAPHRSAALLDFIVSLNFNFSELCYIKWIF